MNSPHWYPYFFYFIYDTECVINAMRSYFSNRESAVGLYSKGIGSDLSNLITE